RASTEREAMKQASPGNRNCDTSLLPSFSWILLDMQHCRQYCRRNGRDARQEREDNRDKMARISVLLVSSHFNLLPNNRARILSSPETFFVPGEESLPDLMNSI